ncbi:hypothetical protein J6590_076489 [Homalodisca vitripennis]|nr:hypothetical protein J6590_076489 [Homalodisca vitripennis]
MEERHITNRKCRNSEAHGQFDRSSLLRETVEVGRVRSLRVKGFCWPKRKGVPPPACFDWRGWFRASFPFFRGDMT